MRIKQLSSMVFVLIVAATNSWGQSTQGGLVGTIRDEKGAEISGAKVRVTNVGTGLQRETTTTGNGFYRVLALPTGTYEITAEAQGFATTTAKDIQVGVDQTRTLDLALRVSARAETVTVQANAELTQTENTKLGEIIDNRKVEDLPLNGRDFAQLARLNPGVATSGGGRRTAGRRRRSIGFFVKRTALHIE
jgi:hypothetical protein